MLVVQTIDNKGRKSCIGDHRYIQPDSAKPLHFSVSEEIESSEKAVQELYVLPSLPSGDYCVSFYKHARYNLYKKSRVDKHSLFRVNKQNKPREVSITSEMFADFIHEENAVFAKPTELLEILYQVIRKRNIFLKDHLYRMNIISPNLKFLIPNFDKVPGDYFTRDDFAKRSLLAYETGGSRKEVTNKHITFYYNESRALEDMQVMMLVRKIS